MSSILNQIEWMKIPDLSSAGRALGEGIRRKREQEMMLRKQDEAEKQRIAERTKQEFIPKQVKTFDTILRFGNEMEKASANPELYNTIFKKLQSTLTKGQELGLFDPNATKGVLESEVPSVDELRDTLKITGASRRALTSPEGSQERLELEKLTADIQQKYARTEQIKQSTEQIRQSPEMLRKKDFETATASMQAINNIKKEAAENPVHYKEVILPDLRKGINQQVEDGALPEDMRIPEGEDLTPEQLDTYTRVTKADLKAAEAPMDWEKELRPVLARFVTQKAAQNIPGDWGELSYALEFDPKGFEQLRDAMAKEDLGRKIKVAQAGVSPLGQQFTKELQQQINAGEQALPLIDELLKMPDEYFGWVAGAVEGSYNFLEPLATAAGISLPESATDFAKMRQNMISKGTQLATHIMYKTAGKQVSDREIQWVLKAIGNPDSYGAIRYKTAIKALKEYQMQNISRARSILREGGIPIGEDADLKPRGYEGPTRSAQESKLAELEEQFKAAVAAGNKVEAERLQNEAKALLGR